MRKLVGRKGFSNNPAAEISEVMKLFEGDMAGLQRDITTLQGHADGTTRGAPPANSQRRKHYEHIVAALRNSAQEHTKAFRDALLLRAEVEKQQSDRQRIFSHSRGVAPATQLDYPLFGNNAGLRSRAPRRRADGAQRSIPPPPPPREGHNGRPSPPAFGVPAQFQSRPAALDWPGTARAPNEEVASGAALGTLVSAGAGDAKATQSSGHSPPGLSSLGGGGSAQGGDGSVSDVPGAYHRRVNEANTGFGQTRFPLPPTEPFREDGVDGEEEARRAAWQVQVQEDAKGRVDESHKVEKMIGQLGQMFSQFSTMVAAQEEVVMHIEDDVEAAHAFAEEGQANLAKYYQIMSGNRGMIIKIFLLLIFFIWVFLGLMR